jgi:uncharacterized membrane protein
VWDVYPFILLNLMLSFQAAYSAPFIMMSQNRQALKDRVMSENDYAINQSAAAAINEALDHLEAQDLLMMKQHEEMLGRLEEILGSVARLAKQPERSFPGGCMKMIAATRLNGRG